MMEAPLEGTFAEFIRYHNWASHPDRFDRERLGQA